MTKLTQPEPTGALLPAGERRPSAWTGSWPPSGHATGFELWRRKLQRMQGRECLLLLLVNG